MSQALLIANKTVRIHRGDGHNGELAGRFNEVFAATMEKLAAAIAQAIEQRRITANQSGAIGSE